jgi:stage II sporulation protein GA (sporulation sigma-E factor processing peptidase)
MYIECLFLFDFWIDFLILLAVSLLLKRKVNFFYLILGSFIGSVSVIILFLNISEIQTFILKVYFSILMILFSFGYKGIKNFISNLVTFYFISILVGGFLYFFKINNLYDSFIFLFIISPIIIYIYIRQAKLFIKKQKLFHNVDIYIGDYILSLVGYLDSGNTLHYKNNPVIVTNLENNFDGEKILIPYNTISNCGLLECIKTDKVIINDRIYKNVFLGFSSNFKIDGADVLLNNKMEG